LNQVKHISHSPETKKTSSRASFFVQPKLSIGSANDIYEQEADAVADKVMQMNDDRGAQTAFFKPAIIPIQRKCSHCEEEERKINRKEANSELECAGANLEGYVNALNGSGHALPEPARNFYESRLGHDFSNVKVHTDVVAAKSAQSINALAYTSGNHVVFNDGQYSPTTESGQKLLAHELTHVVQQSKANSNSPVQLKAVDDAEHIPCRSSRPTAFADLQGWERQAITQCRSAATALSNFKPAMAGATESPATRTMRDMLWRRFHLNYDRFAKCAAIPQLIDKYDKVANNIASIDYTYKCADPGKEPSGECTDKPGIGLAWTAQGTAKTQLCDGFWSRPDPDKPSMIVHELFHYSYGMGDCPSAANDDNPECYALFAAELAGATTSANTWGDCCPDPKDPLPPPDIEAFNSTGCPSGVTIGLPEIEAGYSFGSGGHGKFLSGGIDFRFPHSSTSDWDFTLGPRASILNSLDKDGRDSYLLGLRFGAQLRSRPWRSGFIFSAFGEAGGVLDAPGKSGELEKGNYIGGGIKLGGAIRLPKEKALTFFTEFAGGQVNTNDNTLRYFTAAAGISIDL
jgi:uncharacterized protein DUF4157